MFLLSWLFHVGDFNERARLPFLPLIVAFAFLALSFPLSFGYFKRKMDIGEFVGLDLASALVFVSLLCSAAMQTSDFFTQLFSSPLAILSFRGLRMQMQTEGGL